MASEVDICNLSLSYLGDEATVASISPPEGSVQAESCARFYPFARDSLLEMHAWGFATKYTLLAELAKSRADWPHTYTQPADAIRVLEVLPPNTPNFEALAHGPVPFSCETDAAGTPIILTNQPGAAVKYVALVTDTTKFSPLFVQALAWYLSSMLAGTILKGDVGAAESKRCIGVMQVFLSQAKASDANQGHIKPVHIPPWLRARGYSAGGGG